MGLLDHACTGSSMSAPCASQRQSGTSCWHLVTPTGENPLVGVLTPQMLANTTNQAFFWRAGFLHMMGRAAEPRLPGCGDLIATYDLNHLRVHSAQGNSRL